MKRFFKRVGKVVAVIAGLVVAALLFVQVTHKRTFEAPITHIKASSDSAMIARGRYIVKGPAHCWTCHAPGNHEATVTIKETAATVPVSPDAIPPMIGGTEFKTPVATFYTPNITPDPETGIGRYTDEQLARAIRYGVSHDNLALAPFMMFQTMNDNDLTAVISYLRATKPVKNYVPPRDLNMLGKIISRFMLEPNLTLPIAKNMTPDTTAAYGEYIVQAMGNCRSCHTRRDKQTGAFVGEPFAGGNEMVEAKGTFVTPNLTNDSTTGRIYTWSPTQFVKRFKMGQTMPGTPMPWNAYSTMSESDMKAIYYYLKTLKGVENKVETTIIMQTTEAN